MSTHNICFYEKKKKNIYFSVKKSASVGAMIVITNTHHEHTTDYHIYHMYSDRQA